MVEYLPIAQATVSQHLKGLKEAGWISGNIEGNATDYELDGTRFGWFKPVVNEIF